MQPRRKQRRERTRKRTQGVCRAPEALEPRLLLSTYTVSSTLDSGPGSLRDAVQEANAHSGADTIDFAPGLSGTITLTSGQIEITDDLTILGPGTADMAISGGGASRVFWIDSGAEASISGLTITGGHAADGTMGSNGASVNGVVTSATSGGNGADGGGIYNLGSLTLFDDVLSKNSAGAGGAGGSQPNPKYAPGNGGNGGNGGGIYSAGNLTITTTTLDGNSAGVGGNEGSGSGGSVAPGQGGSGGAIFQAAGTLVMLDSTISNNLAGDGGGPTSPLALYPPGSGGSGGGIHSAAPLTVANCTIAKNAAGHGQQPGNGGGVDLSGTAHLTNCTVMVNLAYVSQSAVGRGPDLYSSGDAILDNTIAGNIYGKFDSASAFNLIGFADSGVLSPFNSNQIGGPVYALDPILAPLGNYGGPTATMPPLPGSTAIDRGSNALATNLDGTPLSYDQRGFPRIVEALHTGTPTVDIGAAEATPLPLPLVVTTTADEFAPNYSATNLSLREAVGAANILHGPQTITFAPGVSGTITLATASLNLSGSTGKITVIGPGSGVLSVQLAQPGGTVFFISGLTSAEIDDLTIRYGGVESFGALTMNNDAIEDVKPAADGAGGVRNRGSIMVLRDSVIRDNTASISGGGVMNAAGGTLVVAGCNISANTLSGFDRAMGAGIENQGALTIADSTIAGNVCPADGEPAAQAFGGGIDNSGTATITNCTISENTITASAPWDETGVPVTGGGGISSSGTLRVVNCTISANTASSGGSAIVTGGGIYISAGHAALYNTIVAGNQASNINGAAALNDIDGTLDAASAYNLIGTGGSGGLLNGGNGNMVDVSNPGLASLGNYGGTTQTMALLPGSPAIDHGSNALALDSSGNPLTTDQRGFARIVNGTVDIGAFEFVPADATYDGKVDFADLVILARHYGMGNASWGEGDFNGDGKVGFDDLVMLARNYGLGTSASAAAGLPPSLDNQLLRLMGRARKHT